MLAIAALILWRSLSGMNCAESACARMTANE